MIAFQKILDAEGFSDWNIHWNTGGGLCFHEKKQIWMNEEEKQDIPLFLHEIAHAKTYKWNKEMNSPTGHHSIFADTFTDLIRKYMCLKENYKKKYGGV